MSRLRSIGATVRALGVSTSTLRCWEANGKLTPARTEGRQRRYDLAVLRSGVLHGAVAPRRTVAYARVSSHDQRADLQRQQAVLEPYCASQGWLWPFEVIVDLGSGMKYHKKGLKHLLDAILSDDVGRFVLTYKERLLRSGAAMACARP